MRSYEHLEIYQPADDSFILSEILKKKIPNLLKNNLDITLLEVGSGTGIQLETALKSEIKKKNIFSCDINHKAVKQCKKLGFNCIKSNLFTNVKGKFDLIVFNPPYLPEDKKEPLSSRISTTGGKKGSEIINRFLRGAKNHLKKNGKIFLLTSSLTKEINFEGYNKRLIDKKKLFYERLYVWEIIIKD